MSRQPTSRTPPSFHLPAFVAGAIAMCVGLGLVGFRAPSSQSSDTVLARGPYAWRALVRVEEKYPYVVPAGKVLIMTSGGYTSRSGEDIVPSKTSRIRVDVDGVTELMLDPVFGPASIVPGWAVGAKSRVSIRFADDEFVGYMFGYLVDA